MRHYEEKTLVFIQKRAESIAAYVKILLCNGYVDKTDCNLIRADADAVKTMVEALIQTFDSTDEDVTD